MAEADIDTLGDIDFEGRFLMTSPSVLDYSAAKANLANVPTGKFLEKGLVAGLAAQSQDIGDGGRDIATRLTEMPSVFDWTGATFDVRLQKALDAVSGTLLCPPNDPITGLPHQMANAVVGHKPTRLICASTWGDAAALTGGNGGSAITGGAILWTGAGGASAITFEPANSGEILIGPALEGFILDGQNGAAEMAHFNNCQYHSLVAKIKRCTLQGARFSSRKGSASNYSLKGSAKLHYDCGAATFSLGSHGLVIEGNGASIPTTQHAIDVFGNTMNGYALVMADADNCHGRVQGYRYPGGTGGAIHHVAGSPHTYPSRNSEFEYVNGVVVEDIGCYGNRMKHYAAEAGGITSANVWHGHLFDPSLHREYATPVYQLRDKLSLPPQAFDLYGSAVSDSFGVGDFWGGRKFPDAVNNAGASIILPSPVGWDDGYIHQVRVRLYTRTSSPPAAGNVALQVSLCCKDPNGSTGWGNAINQTAVIACAAPGTQSTSLIFTFDLDTLTPLSGAFPLAFTRGFDIGLNINRKANDALDTYADYVWFSGATLFYRGKGPRGSGIGSISIPPFA